MPSYFPKSNPPKRNKPKRFVSFDVEENNEVSELEIECNVTVSDQISVPTSDGWSLHELNNRRRSTVTTDK